ncbi:hypothetical protein F7725_001471 [Dissostichus mawsoni]|uniref:Uncharacterized protein n=1 Tax=Dissostichus mawsoni TaxID=36200 RepID=A0A7J5ZHW8_DISMA|nr:hypothetical protein F7725_001471 [Dissostichus mawsoni]
MSSLDHVLLHTAAPPLLWEFCRLMDGLSDRDWTRFGCVRMKDVSGCVRMSGCRMCQDVGCVRM